MIKKVNICGIPFRIEELDVIDEELEGLTQGKISYSRCLIEIKKSLPPELKKSVIIHEVLHGILMELGYSEQSEDETFVQGLSNAIYQIFDFREDVINK